MAISERNDMDSGARRRCVVLFADLVESVALMEQFEALVIERWRGFERKVRRQRELLQDGRVIRSAGDALLMTFDQPAAAVRAAFELHRTLAEGDAETSHGPELRLRVGLHQTEVVFAEHDIYGAGVNLTARLAALGSPGDTVLSLDMREALTDRLDADIEDLGMRYMKHVAEPQRVFRARPPGHRTPGFKKSVATQATVVGLQPALAVIPFSAPPGELGATAAGHAIAEELAASLAAMPELRVLSLNSTAPLRDAVLDADLLRQLPSLLGVSYLLVGRCYQQADKLRAHLELLALPGGEALWRHALQCTVETLFVTNESPLAEAVAQVSLQIVGREQRRVRQLPMDSLPAYSLFLGANELMHSLVRSSFERAREALEHLSERHPRQAATEGLLARWHVFSMVQGWARDEAEAGRRVRDHALRAMERDPMQPVALAALALYELQFERRLDEAGRLNEAAIAEAPSDPYPLAQQSAVWAYRGDGTQALQCAQSALNCSPLDPKRYLFESYASMAAISAGDLDSAVEWARTSLQRQALHAPSHRLLIGSLQMRGDAAEATQALTAYHEHCPQSAAQPLRRVESPLRWRIDFEASLLEAGLVH